MITRIAIRRVIVGKNITDANEPEPQDFCQLDDHNQRSNLTEAGLKEAAYPRGIRIFEHIMRDATASDYAWILLYAVRKECRSITYADTRAYLDASL